MNALTFEIELLEPLLIGRFGAGDENSETSFDYVPGSTLRGMFIYRYTHANKLITHRADELSHRLFFSNSVRYLNAYLMTEKRVRTLPTPLSWRIDEDDGSAADEAMIYDSALMQLDAIDKPERVKKPFCYTGDGEATLYAPTRRIGLHNASTTRFIKRSEDSTVFRYDSLEAGQIFGAVVICDDKDLLKNSLLPLLDDTDLFLGRSRSAGYGQARVIATSIKEEWQEYVATKKPTEELLTLTLLSDAILRDRRTGQITLDVQKGCGWEFKPKEVYMASDAVGSFNRTWGLPLVQTPTVRAGTVLCFEKSAEVEAHLAQCVKNGIGERRNEGFGRVALNWTSAGQLKQQSDERKREPKETVALVNGDQTLAQGMVNRLLRRELDAQLEEKLGESGLKIAGRIENAQLARLRLIARDAWRTDQASLISCHLKSMRQTAKSQYRAAIVDGKDLGTWLGDDWIDRLWRENFASVVKNARQIGDVRAAVDEDIKLEYVVRLIDGLCVKRIKAEQQEPELTEQGVA